MKRIEAVLFASSAPVARDDLARVVGPGVSVDLLIEDLAADLETCPYEIARTGNAFALRTRPAYAPAIRAAANTRDQALDLSAAEITALAAIALHQPVTREALGALVGRPISRDLIVRLAARGLIAPGPRAPQRGAPYTYVTTDGFLVAFDLETLADLPNPEQLDDAGLRASADPARPA